MMHFQVMVLVDRTWYYEFIDGAGDLESACEILLRKGFFTSHSYGPVWFPPHRIKAVELASSTRPIDPV